MSISELTRLVPPPSVPEGTGTAKTWKAAERAIGINLPTDYRAFVDTYGSGLLSGFIIVYSPFAESEFLALEPSIERDCKVLRHYKDQGEITQFAIHPERPGLLPWGNDENGNGYYWLTDGDTDNWSVVVGAGGFDKWQRFDLSMTGFLSKTLKREIRCSIWPAGFPNQKAKRTLMFIPASQAS